jgi:HEAT repeat protein
MDIKDLERIIGKEGDINLRHEALLSMRGANLPADDSIRLLLLAMQDGSWRVRKAAVDVLFDTFPPDDYIDGLINLLYIEDNAGARNSAIEILTRMGSKATANLERAFDTTNYDVRKFIVDIMGEVRDREAIPTLIRALRDEDENVVASAAEHLGTMREPTVIDSLLDLLKAGDLWTSYPAIEALGNIGDPVALPALINALNNKSLCEPGLRAIGKLGGLNEIDVIMPHLESKSKAVQYEAVVSLEALYNKGVTKEQLVESFQKHYKDKIKDILLNFATKHRHKVRVSAIVFLGLLNDESALEPLLEIATDDKYAVEVMRTFIYIGKSKPQALIDLLNGANAIVRRFLSKVIMEINSDVFFDQMVKLLGDDDGHVRSNAAIGLGRIGDPRAMNVLMDSLLDPYEDVQSAVVVGLKSLKDHVDVARLIPLLKNPQPSLRRNVLLVLGAVGTKEAVELISFSLKDDNVLVRKAVIKALSSIKSEEAFSAVMHALTDESTSIRSDAAASLGVTQMRRFLDPLKLLLTDTDDMVRVTTARALGKLGAVEAMPHLVGLLKDDNGFVITTAIDAIGKLGGTEARSALMDSLSSTDREVRRSAIHALGGFEGVQAELLQCLRDEDWSVRVAAIESLINDRKDDVVTSIAKLYETEQDSVVRSALEKYLNVK